MGTFILAPSVDRSSHTLELLDGQQRATAIAFGFFDPWADHSHTDGLWRIPKLDDIPILWLDLLPPDNAELRFAFRLLTRSQPWGYERKDNQSPLTAIERRKFLSQLAESLPTEEQGKRYLELPLTCFWPWDAKLPVPFAFLLDSFQATNWKIRLKSLCKKHYQALKTKYPQPGGYLRRIEAFLATPQAEDLRDTIWSVIRKTHVPVLNIPREVLEQNRLPFC